MANGERVSSRLSLRTFFQNGVKTWYGPPLVVSTAVGSCKIWLSKVSVSMPCAFSASRTSASRAASVGS